ncbi:hypothetical protein JG687_00001283 [Phytophthora cactorum]|uniref:Uncharacterized protein n=1 Tax=Phytophthora cactorum TaxID=29920 RepID=A0A329SGE3_9STRA|nr:hypothetical protein Pcac1_g9930 [Phytophthora cactorum]KAG2825354.1 hypothetical protein PC112_g9705 [Phytophthora cactorum]KAG2829465.1 hypothetical protein PC111_g7752 [Phytophthora cactorum]KAG2858195.1 hypothetical protein PC113_g10038 [Phytophthora cactorum]KAG2905418.1 hypothetical protein PC114_g11551 [Phytophthora cactorum]
MLKNSSEQIKQQEATDNHTAGSDERVPSHPKKSFIIEVERLKRLSVNANIEETSDARPAEGATEVFQLIDKMAEKQQRSKRIRTMMQRAAHKTILVVRTRNSIQAAEIVSVRFNQHKVTEVPRSVQLAQICTKVLRHTRFTSAKKRPQFEKIFSEAREIDALLKDMFWYVTAHCFQPGRQPKLEASFYQRIADSFTSLFVRLQMKPSSRDVGFFDQLPDVVAQILFVALYEAFPRSRKLISSDEIRHEILRTCYCWILGFVPADLKYDHWVAVDEDSPKRIAALADFPAMRNRMIRAERVERTRQAVKTWHEDQDDDDDEAVTSGEHQVVVEQEATESNTKLLPSLAHQKSRRSSAFSISAPKKHPRPASGNGKSDDSARSAAHVETRERYTYEMCNSPLIGAFLARHKLEANTPHLRVQMRLTSGKQRDLNDQEALRAAVGVVPARRRRLADPTAFGDALVELETFGNAVRNVYSKEKDQARTLDSRERKRLAGEHRALETQLSELRQSGERMHEFSNQIVSKSHIDALLRPSSRGNNRASPTTAATESTPPGSAGSTRPFTPRPPPGRGGSFKSTSTARTQVQAGGSTRTIDNSKR